MDFKQYPSYKDSGVEWLGEVPEHWQLTKIKFLSTFVKGKNPEQLYDEKGKGMYSYLSMGYLRGKSSELFAPLTNNLTLVDDEQTLIIWDGSNAGEFVKAKQGILSSTMGAAFTKKVNKQFFWYLCLSIEPEIRKRTNGMGIPHVSGDFLKNFLVAMPNLGGQSKLAAYLDSETSRIDNLIAKQEKLIEKLEEHRKSVISHAVTKGLDPNAKMKDSGVGWLGEVPEHWVILKLKQITKLESGNSLALEDIQSFGNYPVYGGNNIRGYTHDYNLDGNYILIGRQGSLCGNINYGFGKFWATEHAVVVYPKKQVNHLYLGELLRTMNLNQYSLASAQAGLSVERISNIYSIYPPIEEQNAIGELIKAKTSYIDSLITKQKELIEKLKEYRTSIISHAVTGKIDVRDLVA